MQQQQHKKQTVHLIYQRVNDSKCAEQHFRQAPEDATEEHHTATDTRHFHQNIQISDPAKNNFNITNKANNNLIINDLHKPDATATTADQSSFGQDRNPFWLLLLPLLLATAIRRSGMHLGGHGLLKGVLIAGIMFTTLAVPSQAQEASGTITLQTDQQEPVTRAKVYIYSYNGNAVLDSLLTDNQGQASFSGLSLATAIEPVADGRNTTVYPNPGSSHRIVVSGLSEKKIRPYATIYDLSGKPVADLKPLESSAGQSVSFTWKPSGNVPDGLYLFRYGATSARINHQQGAPSFSGNVKLQSVKPSNNQTFKRSNSLKHQTSNTEQSYTHTFTYQPSATSNILFSEATKDYELTEGSNTLTEILTPTAFMHFYEVNGNVPEASVSITADGNTVFSGEGSFETDSVYMDSREKELNLNVKAPGYQTLDSVLTGSWQGQAINYTLQEENPQEEFNHVITGEAMNGGYVTIWDADADTLLTEAEEVSGSYFAEFTNTNESQNVDITQSAPYVNQKTWNGSVTDTLDKDLTDVIVQYEVDMSVPNGSSVEFTPRSTGSTLTGTELSYETGAQTDSADVTVTNPDWQDKDTTLALAYGANSFEIGLDSLQYEFAGSAGPDGASVKMFNPENGEVLDSAIVSGDSYSMSETRVGALDSVRMVQSKKDYQSLDTIIRNVNTGVNTVDLPSLKPDTLMYSLFGSAATDSTEYTIVDNANTNDTIGQGMAFHANDPDYKVDYERLATESELDSVTYLLSREGYNDTTITRDVNSDGGSYQIDLPQLTEVPEYVLNSSVLGDIIRKKTDGYTNGIGNAFIKLEGLNIAYKDSLTMNSDSYYEFTDLHIPVDEQGNPDTARYIRTITPTDTTSTQMFQAYKDTVEITKDMFDLGTATVQQLDQNVTLTGTIRDIYDETKTLDSTKVRFKKASDSTLLAEAITGSDGKYRLPDIECGTEGFFEVGYHDHSASGYLSDVGHTYTIKPEVVKPAEDSVETINYMLVPTELELPATENDPNQGQTVTADPDKIEDLIRGSESTTYMIDAEEAMDRQVRLNYGSMSASEKQTFRDSIIAVGDSLFYGISKSVPMDDENRPFKLVTDYIDAGQFSNDYHPAQNYHPDSLGWNVSAGTNETHSQADPTFDNGKQYQEDARIGGYITIDLTDIAGNLKEIYGRSEHRNDVTGYPSYMNADASYPTLDDRAINYLHHENEKQRLGEDSKAYYPLDKLEYSIPASAHPSVTGSCR